MKKFLDVMAFVLAIFAVLAILSLRGLGIFILAIAIVMIVADKHNKNGGDRGCFV